MKRVKFFSKWILFFSRDAKHLNMVTFLAGEGGAYKQWEKP
jgi:hypothetical protein